MRQMGSLVRVLVCETWVGSVPYGVAEFGGLTV